MHSTANSWNTKLCSAFKKPENRTRIIVQFTPTRVCLTANNCVAFWLSELLRSRLQLHPLFSLFFFKLHSLSTPPLNRTAVLAGYHLWSIPCYHREINYLNQAAGERGNNERMHLLPRRWQWSLNMNLSLVEEIYVAWCGHRVRARFAAEVLVTSVNGNVRRLMFNQIFDYYKPACAFWWHFSTK